MTYIIAEMSSNHLGSLERAHKIVYAAWWAGCNAIKIQTYTANTMCTPGTMWRGRDLHELYRECYTPWEWHGELVAAARDRDLDVIATVYEETALEMWRSLEPDEYKISSFELQCTGLIKQVAKEHRPITISTGMGSDLDIAMAVEAAAEAPCITLLHCVSAYPTKPELANLPRIQELARQYPRLQIGLSDHTDGTTISLAAIALGATTIERHLTIEDDEQGEDGPWSLRPVQMRQLVHDARTLEAACTSHSHPGQYTTLRRTLTAVRDIAKGEVLTHNNIKPMRGSGGLHPATRFHGHIATQKIARGTGLTRELFC